MEADQEIQYQTRNAETFNPNTGAVSEVNMVGIKRPRQPAETPLRMIRQRMNEGDLMTETTEPYIITT